MSKVYFKEKLGIHVKNEELEWKNSIVKAWAITKEATKKSNAFEHFGGIETCSEYHVFTISPMRIL